MIYLLPQIIEESAAKHPEKCAFRFREHGLTYGDLAQKVVQLANSLRQHGVRRGDRVGIFLPKGLEAAISLYAIMQAGAAYVPLDFQMPQSRLAFILQDCEIRHLISAPQRASMLSQIAPQTRLECLFGVDEVEDAPYRTVSWAEVYQAPTTVAPVGIMEQDMAYLMYTSGSTGEPKGMIHTHHSGLSYARLSAEVYDLRNEDRLSNFSPLHFDMSTFDYFSGPLAGATTVIIPEEYALLPASLSTLMAEEKLTIWYSVPFVLIQLCLRGSLDERDLESLRWVLFGGEPFPPKYLHALMACWPQARFSNVYGPAEVNQCTFYHVPLLEHADESSIPIGRIWPNAEGLIVDGGDRAVEPGQPGELLVRTPTMMQGYWRRPDLNAKAFYRREQDGGHSHVFYRTGDLVQTLPNGEMLFLGRKDRQVKVRGYRIELDEIEAALLIHESVEEAAVFASTIGDGDAQVGAAVLLKPALSTTVADIVKHLTGCLPRYAVPTRLTIESAFPRTTSGKIDRRALQTQAAQERP